LLDSDPEFWKAVYLVREKLELPNEGWGIKGGYVQYSNEFKKRFSGNFDMDKIGQVRFYKDTAKNLKKMQVLEDETKKLLDLYGIPYGWLDAFRDLICTGYLRLPKYNNITLKASSDMGLEDVDRVGTTTATDRELNITITARLKKNTLISWVKENWETIDLYQRAYGLPNSTKVNLKIENIPYLRIIIDLRSRIPKSTYSEISNRLISHIDEKLENGSLNRKEYDRLSKLYGDETTVRKYHERALSYLNKQAK